MTEKNTKQELIDEYKRLCAETKKMGLKLPAGASGINLKNTKAEILFAVNKISGALKTGAPGAAPEEKPKNEIVNNAVTYSDKKEDNDLKYLNEKIIEKIQALDSAKSLKKSEYDSIVALENELLKFVEMINNMKTKNIAQAESHKEQQENQKSLIEQTRLDTEEISVKKIGDARDALEALEMSIEEAKKKLDAERAVEEEAYRYKISEENKKSDDDWSDIVASREENFAEIEAETQKLTEELASKESLKKELESKLAQLPELLKKAEEEGAAAKEKELGREYGYESSKNKKEAENNIQALQDEIELLRKDYEDALAEKISIQAKLDKAYEENNKLYIQTVQSTGGVKILNNSEKS